MKKIIIAIVAVLVIAVGFVMVNKQLRLNSDIVNSYQKDGVEAQDIQVEIPMGSTVLDIANILEENKIIDSVDYFYGKAKKEGINTFQYGTFTINTYMNFYEIVDILSNPANNQNQIKFLIKEGETQNQIAENIAKTGLATKEEFLTACNEHTFDRYFLKDIPQRESRLEGYLYPDTYFLEKDMTCDEIIDTFLGRFEEIILDEHIEGAFNLGYNFDQMITVASMIEREVRYPAERGTVASVIYNRLEAGMPLQIDATVLYALGEHKDRVVKSDLEIDSPYNTYKIKGLPLGPISNPGIESINAASNPENTDYLYYVLEDFETGQHYFTDNYDDFLDAKDRYLKNMQ